MARETLEPPSRAPSPLRSFAMRTIEPSCTMRAAAIARDEWALRRLGMRIATAIMTEIEGG